MTPGFPNQTGNYYPPGSMPQHDTYGQSAINDPNPAEIVQNERINITRTIRTQGLKPDQPHVHSEQPSANPLQRGKIKADSTQPPHFNQLPKHYPAPSAAPTLNRGLSGTDIPALRHQAANQFTDAPPTAGRNQYIPMQANQDNCVPSTNPFSTPGGNSYQAAMPWNQAPVKSLTELQKEHDISSSQLFELCGKQAVALLNQMSNTGPTFSTCQPAGTSASHSTYPGAGLSGASARLPFSQIAFHRPAADYSGYRPSENASGANAIDYGHSSLVPTNVKSQNLIQILPSSSQLKRPHNPDWNHYGKIGAFQPIKSSPSTITYQNDQAMGLSGPAYSHQYSANLMKQRTLSNEPQGMMIPQAGYSAARSTHSNNRQMTHHAQPPINPVVQNLSTPPGQNLTANPSSPLQSPGFAYSATSYPVSVSSSSSDRTNSSLSATTSKSTPVNYDTVQQATGCQDTGARQTSKETQQQNPTPASTRVRSKSVDFDWQAPEFDRQSKEILLLIKETQKIMGIDNLDVPWVTPAHVLIIAADTIEGNITETTMQIFRLAYLKSLPSEPDNPLENVNQAMARVVSNWYEQSEEERIETEYFELLNSINKYRQAKKQIKLQKRASFSRVFQIAAEILKSERKAIGSSHLPPKEERADLSNYIQTALEFIKRSSGSTKETTTK